MTDDTRLTTRSLVAAFLAAPAFALAQGDGRAVSQPRAADEKATPSPKTPDFKVVFWYQKGQLKHQAYDVRKGQYTKAVDDWVNRVYYDSSGLYVVPGPMAFVRDVYLANEKGDTEQAKLAAAIAAIAERVAARDRQAVADRIYTRGYLGPAANVSFAIERDRMIRTQSLSPIQIQPSPGSGGYSVAPAPGFPFPYPIGRPHP
jgi:hypothetical protein